MSRRLRTVEIRPVTLDDLETLIDIYLDTARPPRPDRPGGVPRPVARGRRDPPPPARSRVAATSGEYVAAMVGDEMAGSASVDLADPLSPGNMMRAVPTAEFGVSVVEAWRGRGIGRALIGHVERWAAEHGVERMVLNVSEANEGAIRLYRELGYRDYDRAMLKRLERP